MYAIVRQSDDIGPSALAIRVAGRTLASVSTKPPISTAESFLTTDDSLGAMAKRLGISLRELVDMLSDPEAARLLDAAIALTEFRAKLRALESQAAAVKTLSEVCASSHVDLTQRRQAATSLLRTASQTSRAKGVSKRADSTTTSATDMSSCRCCSKRESRSHATPRPTAPKSPATSSSGHSRKTSSSATPTAITIPDLIGLGRERAEWLTPLDPPKSRLDAREPPPGSRRRTGRAPARSPADLAARSGAPPPINSP